MSELNLCSRREADRWIRAGAVSVKGRVVDVGEKVDADLGADAITISSDDTEARALIHSDNVLKAIVFNKPPGYVSGQAEHGHQPAIRLLTRSRLWNPQNSELSLPQNSWKHFAPAGRLDLDSSGLLIFARAGVIAKKLIHHNSNIEKEYIVDVVAAARATRGELSLDSNFRLPPPSANLSPMIAGGKILLGEHRPLKPCQAEWLKVGERLRIILKEGRKQQIRRACRELLGYHVVGLDRIRIGKITLNDLPQGRWRPMSQDEVQGILTS